MLAMIRMSDANVSKEFLGTLSLTNGTGHNNVPPNGTAPGTVRFLNIPLRGMVFSAH